MNSSNRTPFPWHYFIRSIRARIILVIVSCVLTFVITRVYTEYIFPKVLLIILFLTIISIIQGYLRLSPFRKTLAKIDEIQVQLPHNKKLNIIYQKNEWVLIQEMLKLTEKYIREQNKQILTTEQQSSTLIESIPNPVIVVDSYLNSKQYNRVFKDKFIKDKNTKVFKEEKLWKIFEHDQVLDIFQKSKNEESVNQLNAFLIDDEYYDISVTPIKDLEGKTFGLLGIFHNVTDSKLTEKMRVDFVANVSHEIRTPLTSIKGFSQLLLAQKSQFPEVLHTPLDRIVYNTERLKDLFDNLLKLSVIESKYELTKENISVAKLFSVITSNIKAKHNLNKLDVQYPKEGFIFGDPKLLDQVFTNLIDNSVKYNPKAETKINISIEKDEKSSFIKISDNGAGISNEEIKRIFERFYRVQGQTTKNIEGTGLGLSIVKHIINKHNGHISVESEIDKGTTFIIVLPN